MTPLLQCRGRLRNAEKKNTWSHIQVCDNSKTVVRHELVNIKNLLPVDASDVIATGRSPFAQYLESASIVVI